MRKRKRSDKNGKTLKPGQEVKALSWVSSEIIVGRVTQVQDWISRVREEKTEIVYLCKNRTIEVQ